MTRGWRAAAVVAVVGVATAAIAQERDGRFLYEAYCAACHGAQARGDGPDAELFSPRPRSLRGDVLRRYPDEQLVERIRHGTPLGLASDPEALKARAADTDLLVAHLKRLPHLQWRRIERGQEIYVDRCEVCHGPFGHPTTIVPLGVSQPPRDLSDPAYQRATTDATLLSRIRKGHRAMPAMVGFDVTENGDALLAFLRLLSPGYELYTRLCSSCHGDDGRGPGGDWASAPRPSVVFDDRYFAKKDPEALRTDIWHMARANAPQMPHMGRVLRPSEVRSIIAYLRSLPAE